MPRRANGYNLTHVLLAILINQQIVRERVLARVLGRNVYAYLWRLRKNGVVIIENGLVWVNPDFNKLVRHYLREISPDDALGQKTRG